MFIRVMVVAVLGIWLPALWAEDTAQIEGRITDAGGLGIAGVKIEVKGRALPQGAGSTSAVGGLYKIENLPPGGYGLTITHVGYKTIEYRGLRLEADQRLVLDFELESSIIFLEQRMVSTSRSQEKILDAPVSVAVVEGREIRSRPAFTLAEHVKALPGVGYIQMGLSQSSTVVRGFNNVFSGALLTLADNRIVRTPSLRSNATYLMPITSDDIERIEVVLGPGSVHHGPNSANGVMHFITRSPFNSKGTNFQIGGGERSLRRVSLRHAGAVGGRLGYKVSAQYYSGSDWEFSDPVEGAARQANPALKSRDFDTDRQNVEARVDYRPMGDLTIIASTGYSSASDIEMTGLGSAQVLDWTYNYVQGRLFYRDWFAQVYHNWSDAGDSFLLRSGAPIVDKSTVSAFQLQHAAALGQRQRFVYGADGQFTRSDTEGTVNGQNEADDSIDEYGAYLQSETRLAAPLELVLALRADDHNRIEDLEFSSRAALVFKPHESQTLRLTYNQASNTPSALNLYLDLLSSTDPFGLAALAPTLGFDPGVDLRVQGTYRGGFDEGFTFRRAGDGSAMFRSSFSPEIAQQLEALGLNPGDPGYAVDAAGYMAMHDPVVTNVMWGIGRQTVLNQFRPVFEQTATGLIAQGLVAAGTDAATAQTTAADEAGVLAAALPSVIPDQLAGLQNALFKLDLEKAQAGEAAPFRAVTDAFNVGRTESTITKTIELGYKGVIDGKFVIAVDAYHTTTENFIGPLAVETPNVFLDATSLAAALGPAMAQTLSDPDNAAIAQVLNGLDTLEIAGVEGNNNGSAVDELVALFTSGAARIPYGTVSPEQAYNTTAVLLTYRNFGEVTIDGLDLSFGYYPIDELAIRGNVSLVDDNFFPNLDNIADVALNAPKFRGKIGAQYRYSPWALQVGGLVRYSDSFRMNSGVFMGEVPSYTVVDLNLNYQLPIEQDLALMVKVDNVLDKRHRQFIGAPKLGRLVYAQLGVSF